MSKLTVKHEDKNGIKLEVGQIVKISNAYFKVDNGYYFIEHEPDAPNWLGSDYGLTRINSRTGELSTGKNTCAFYPLCSFCSDRRKNAAADEWNEAHCEIEVVYSIKNDAVIKFFANELETVQERIKRDSWNFGEESEIVKKEKAIADYYKSIIKKLTQPTTTLQEIEESEEEPKQEATTLEKGAKVKVHIYGTDGKEIKTRNKDVIFEVKKENGHLGIDYNTERSPYTCHGDIFQPFYTFANNCIFERITDGKKFYFSCIYNCLVEKEEPQPTPPEPTKAEKSAEVEPEPQTATEPIEEPTAEEKSVNEPQTEAETATAEIVPAYYPISEQTARTAQEINSFHEYKPGSATATYKSEVDEVYRIVERIAEKRPEQTEKALNMANRYSKKLADYYNAYYRNEASCPSVLICGGGNFPTRKKEKQNIRRDSLMKEWQYLQEYKKKINNILSMQNVIKSGDFDAVDQLKAKIEKLEQAQELYKSANKAIRLKETEKGNAELEKLGYTKTEINKLRKPDFCGRVGYPPYVLQNNLANIKRLKARLANLEKAKVTETTEETATDTDGNELFQIVRNTEIMRLQLFFYGKPDIETRNILKSNGFKWAPSKKAWQRVLNSNAEYALERLKKELAA